MGRWAKEYIKGDWNGQQWNNNIEEQPHGRGSCLILTPAQWFEIGKQAAEHGVTASVGYFAKKYPKLPLKETTMWRLKNLYQSALKSGKSESSRISSEDLEDLSKEVEELPCKKTGRLLLIGNELDTQVQEYVRLAREMWISHKHFNSDCCRSWYSNESRCKSVIGCRWRN